MTARIRACVWDMGDRVFTWYDDGTAVRWERDSDDEKTFYNIGSLDDFNNLLMDHFLTPLGRGRGVKRDTPVMEPLPF